MLAGVTLRARLLLPLLAVAALVGVGGCGSGGDSDTAAANTIPKAQFLKKVGAICADAVEEIERVYRQYSLPPYPGGQKPTNATMNRVAEEVVIPARAKQVRRMRALGYPPGEEEEVEAILTAIEEGIERGEEDRRSLRGDGTSYAFEKALQLEIAYGIEECATG